MVLKILIANNSLSAYKFVYSIKKTKVDCEFFGVATKETLCQTYVKLLKNFVILPSGDSSLNFSNISCIIDAAKLFKVDYVYPGWGYLSENSDFVEMLKKSDIKFIGPIYSSMRLLGNKLVATELASSLSIPIIPYILVGSQANKKTHTLEYEKLNQLLQNNNDIKKIFGNKNMTLFKLMPTTKKIKLFEKISFKTLCEYIPRKNYDANVERLRVIWKTHLSEVNSGNSANVKDELSSKVFDFVSTHGFPLLLKASSTGGGRGIYELNSFEELKETLSCLPNDVKTGMMICKLIKDARHVEFQMVCDNYDNIICLGGRDCTLQRKNQKIIEEKLIMDENLYDEMVTHATKLLRESKYTGVATVEFLMTQNEYYFLEVNTRIQVEHPVTEMLTKINIPELQLKIAMNKSIEGLNVIQSKKHVIGCRIVAEDSWNDFIPTIGEYRIEAPNENNIFGYFSATSGTLNKNGDSQFGHIFVKARSRKECIKKLSSYLRWLFIDGVITNKDFITKILESQMFLERKFYTKTLEKIVYKYQQTGLQDIDYEKIDTKTLKIDFNAGTEITDLVIAQNIITGSDIFAVIYALYVRKNYVSVNFTDFSFQYHFEVFVISSSLIILKKNNSFNTYKYFMSEPHLYIFTDSCYKSATFVQNIDTYTIKCINDVYKFSTNYFESNLTAPTDGIISHIFKKDNDFVEKKDKYAEIEIMKTRVVLSSEYAGTIILKKSIGDIVKLGEVIATVQANNNLEIPIDSSKYVSDNIEHDDDYIYYANYQYTFSALKSIFIGFELPDDLYDMISLYQTSDINTCLEILRMYYELETPSQKQIKAIIITLSKLLDILSIDTEKILKVSLLEVLELLDSIVIEKNNSIEIYNQLLKIRACFSEYKFKHMNMWYDKNADQKKINDYLSRHCSYKEGVLFILSYFRQYSGQLINKYLCNITGKEPKDFILDNGQNICKFECKGMQCVFLMCDELCKYTKSHDLVIHYNCKKLQKQNHFYISTHNETPFVTYKYNSIESSVDIITEYIRNKKVCMIDNLIYKDIFRNLCIYNEKTHLNVVYKIDTHSGNTVLDIKNLSHAIKQIICAIKITSQKHKISESHYEIIVEGKIKMNNESMHSIVKDCIFYYSKGYINHGVTGLTVKYENDQEHEIRLSIKRGVMEQLFYTKNVLQKFCIDDYEIINIKTTDKETMDKITNMIANESITENSRFLIRNNTISNSDFIYLLKLYFAKSQIEVEICEHFLSDMDTFSNIDQHFVFNNKKYSLSTQHRKIGLRGFYVKFKDAAFTIMMNDILHKNGSFSIEEDIFYTLMLRNAKAKKMPFIFVACNSGARIGVFEDLKNNVKIVNDEIYSEQKEGILSKNDTIISVYGNTSSGPENLAFSGLIAKETSDAYENIFYLSYVTGRSVGIGAYINKLGQRIIQKRGSSILLTGYQALNKVLKANLYTNNEQIGGTEIMNDNGNTHLNVTSEYEAIQEIMKWLDYHFCRSKNFDHITAVPVHLNNEQKKEKYLELYRSDVFNERFNCREILEYLCDVNSKKEYKRQFGKNIILARAKIDNISFGIIAPETNDYVDGHKITKNVLDPESTEKIAQGISDFSNEGLNILIIANFKGFTGGKDEMSKNILKYGSLIIENIKRCKTRVIVYLPPGGEIRGGSWVVFDKFINDKITILAHPNSQVGIIEADAMADLKFKENECIELYKRSNVDYTKKKGDDTRKKLCMLHDSVYRMYLNDLVDDLVTVGDLKDYVKQIMK